MLVLFTLSQSTPSDARRSVLSAGDLYPSVLTFWIVFVFIMIIILITVLHGKSGAAQSGASLKDSGTYATGNPRLKFKVADGIVLS